MKKHQMSHSQDFSRGEHGEKSVEHLLDFAGLTQKNKCTILVTQTEGGAIMEEMTKQTEGEEELLRQEVHKELMDAISKLLEQAEVRDLEVILQFIKRLI